MKRWLTLTGILAATFGGILWFLLLASATSDTALFGRHYPLLLGLNIIMALVLLGLVGWQLKVLWRDYRNQVFGARLKLRLMLMFGLIAVLPGVLVYAVSIQFVTRSIDSWFDVRVEKALESGLDLGRTALDTMLADLHQKGRAMAMKLADRPDSGRRALLSDLREQSGVQSAVLFTISGRALLTANADYSTALPITPTEAQLKHARINRSFTAIDSHNGKELNLHVIVPVPNYGLFEEPRLLQLVQPVPSQLSQNAEAVQSVYRDYQELQLARQGLTQIYALTLTLTVLVALFSAFALAFFMARRLAAPLYILAEGTQAVAQGDFSPRQAVYSGDELGILTQSFNRMTRQLDDARRETERHRAEVESARAYLESILANLSAGVLVCDRRFVLRTLNEGALAILDDNFDSLIGTEISHWPRQQALGNFILEGFAKSEDPEWQGQLELHRPHALAQVLLVRGSRLPLARGGGFVIVFDDVTKLITAQRSAAWGEVAQRLAHEIKNPLTPIQLSAERLSYKLIDKLTGSDAEFLERGTQTIINQVQAMKRMVNDFRDYARLPSPELAPLDLNALIREVLGLYETSHARLELGLQDALTAIEGDATQLRQVIHNLLRNAEDALEGSPNACIRIETAAEGRSACLRIIDNGAGFPSDILPRVFEPYVTTKPRGTGLGLPIVKKIIDEHGGRIEITNLPPHGAQITIHLPFVKEDKHGANTGC